MAFGIDLNKLLKSFDEGDYFFYDGLSDEQKKEFQPWLVMRYASSSKKDPVNHLVFVNEIVNKEFSVLSKHPKLQWMLLCVSSSGKYKKYDHPFIKPPKKQKKDKFSEMLLGVYRGMNQDEIILFVRKNEDADIVSLMVGAGYDEKEVKKYLKNFRKSI